MKSAVAFTYAYSGHKTDILSWNFRYDTDPAIIRQFWNKEYKLTILVSDYMHIIHSTYILSSFKKNSLDTGGFMKKVLSVYNHSLTTIYLSLSAQVAISTFFMKSPVSEIVKLCI